jgi:hypothetical protein
MKSILINTTIHIVLFVTSVVGTVAASFLVLFAAMSALYACERAAGLTFAGNMAPRLVRSAMVAVGL